MGRIEQIKQSITRIPDYPIVQFTVADAALLRPRPRRGLPGVEIVPVHDRVEAERVGALRLPSPERPDREHHDVPFAERVDRAPPRGSRGTGRSASVPDSSMSFGFAGELHHDARARTRRCAMPNCCAICRSCAVSSPARPLAAAAPAPRWLSPVERLERLNAQRHRVRRHVLADAGVRVRTRRAAAAAAERAEPAAADREHRRLVEVHRQVGVARSRRRAGSSCR